MTPFLELFKESEAGLRGAVESWGRCGPAPRTSPRLRPAHHESPARDAARRVVDMTSGTIHAIDQNLFLVEGEWPGCPWCPCRVRQCCARVSGCICSTRARDPSAVRRERGRGEFRTIGRADPDHQRYPSRPDREQRPAGRSVCGRTSPRQAGRPGRIAGLVGEGVAGLSSDPADVGAGPRPGLLR